MAINFSLIAFFILLYPSSKVFSQSEDSVPKLTIYCDRFITVFFPGKIREIINNNSDLEISMSDGSKGELQIKAKTPRFQKTRIGIVTIDMRHFPFDVSCSNVPMGSAANLNRLSDKKKTNHNEKSDSSDMVYNRAQ